MTSNEKNIIIKCPGCSSKLAIPDSACGKKVRCTKCKKVLQVPVAPHGLPEPSTPKRTQLSIESPPLTRAEGTGQPSHGPVNPLNTEVKASSPPSKQDRKKVERLKIRKFDDVSDLETCGPALSTDEAQKIKDRAIERRAEIERLRQINEGLLVDLHEGTEFISEPSILRLRNIVIAGLTVFLASTTYFVFINPPSAEFYNYKSLVTDGSVSAESIAKSEAKRIADEARRVAAEKLAIAKEAEALRLKKLALYSTYYCSKVEINNETNLVIIDYDFKSPRDKSAWQPSTKTYINESGNLTLKGSNGSGIFAFSPRLASPFSMAIFLKAIEASEGRVNIYLHRLKDRKMMEIGSGKTMKLSFSNKKPEKSNDGPSDNLRLYEMNSFSNYSPFMRKFMTSTRMFPVAGASISDFPWSNEGTSLIIRSKTDGYPEVIIGSSKIQWINSSQKQGRSNYADDGKGPPDTNGSDNRRDTVSNNGNSSDGNTSDGSNKSAGNIGKKQDNTATAPAFLFEEAQMVISFSGLKELEIQKMALKVPFL